MKKRTLASIAAAGALVATACVAGQSASAAPAPASSTVTATVTGGSLAISAPTTTLSLSSAAPGQTGTATLTPITVTDQRAGTTGWTASAQISDFTSASLTATIPATDVSYAPINTTKSGSVTLAQSNITGDDPATAQVVQTATAVTGNNTVTWDATISLAVPTTALAASDYSATITHSVG